MKRLAVLAVVLLAGFAVILLPELRVAVLQRLFPELSMHTYSRVALVVLLGEHLQLVLASSLAAAILGVGIGIAVTRTPGRPFLPLVRDAASIMQTFPPVAVLALAVPLLGFGTQPAILALILYSVLPILSNTIAAMEGVPPDALHAARGMGMTPLQRLLMVELPIGRRVILAGIRTSVIINVGTATIGSVVGAGGLGSPIVAGLVRNNPALILEGALTAAWLAFVIDAVLGLVGTGANSPGQFSGEAA